jgi:hypothetical protein
MSLNPHKSFDLIVVITAPHSSLTLGIRNFLKFMNKSWELNILTFKLYVSPAFVKSYPFLNLQFYWQRINCRATLPNYIYNPFLHIIIL